MNRKNVFFTYLCATCGIIVPTPARFAFAIILLLVFNLQIVTGILFIHGVKKFNLTTIKTPLLTFELLSITILSKEILNFICPLIAFSLNFIIFIPAVSTALISYFFETNEENLLVDLKVGMKQVGIFSGMTLIFFLFQDILGYGTITLPSTSGLFVIKMPFYSINYSAASFLASIPGTLIIISILVATLSYIMNKINNIERVR